MFNRAIYVPFMYLRNDPFVTKFQSRLFRISVPHELAIARAQSGFEPFQNWRGECKRALDFGGNAFSTGQSQRSMRTAQTIVPTILKEYQINCTALLVNHLDLDCRKSMSTRLY